ncbi:glycosyltransferase family 2 protein [Nitrosospira sp. Nsp1]|uniref:glycosyltransferase family 2 protein n=1 Tax=Nitrosospira sp. Nsp1 TaxID=136547 RepID=UPI00087EF318|nr:glycosyltransferase family 2 protein [Nitrosospira sp. Nsp1]SCX47637.1 Glycosyl transferase family 2 [Nitrosospira sp. Nsp1]
MIRDEKGILETFCAHALSLFDRIILIDHLSSDGTREYIKLLSEKHSNIEYYFFDEPGYYQSELMTWAAKNLVNNKAPGWVFFLDADEFLPFKSKEEFDRKLSQFGSSPVIFMPWLNLVPLDMESGNVINQFFLKPPKPSRHRKIAFQPNLIPSSDYFIVQGNHAFFIGTNSSKVKFPAKESFPIYHLPIRTKRQLQKKILNGVKSYRHMGRNRNGKIGSHWDEIHQIMEETSLTNEMMAGIAAQYSDMLHPPYERSLDQLRKEGYRELQMEICFSKLMISFDSIVKGRKDGVIGENDDSPSQPANYRKIDFNRSTRSVQITEEQESS